MANYDWTSFSSLDWLSAGSTTSLARHEAL